MFATLLTFSMPSFCRSNSPKVSCKKGVLKIFAKFTGKHLWQSLLFNNVADLRPATLLRKRLLYDPSYKTNNALKSKYVKSRKIRLVSSMKANIFDNIIVGCQLLKQQTCSNTFSQKPSKNFSLQHYCKRSSQINIVDIRTRGSSLQYQKQEPAFREFI